MRSIFFALILFPFSVWAQSVTVAAPSSFNSGDAVIDLSRELARTGYSFSAVRLRAKSGLGGVSVSLMINNEVISGVTVETDPALFSAADGFYVYEIPNIENVRISSASLAIKNASQLKLQSVELVAGYAQEPVTLGSYPAQYDEPAREPRRQPLPQPLNIGSTTTTTSPTTTTSTTQAWWRRPSNPNVAPTPTPTPTTQPARRCSMNKRNQLLCVGDKVKTRIGAIGTIVAIYVEGRDVTVSIELKNKLDVRSIDEVKLAY